MIALSSLLFAGVEKPNGNDYGPPRRRAIDDVIANGARFRSNSLTLEEHQQVLVDHLSMRLAHSMAETLVRLERTLS